MDDPTISSRTIRLGALAWIAGPIQFVVVTTVEALLLVQQGYAYSFFDNTISNLGDPSLFPFPYFWMLNLSAIVLGALILAGVPAFRARRPAGPLGSTAVVLLILGGIGAIGVGIFNEHLNYPVHIAMAGLAFVSDGLVLLVVGVAALRDPQWRRWAVPCLAGAVVTAFALVLFGTNTTWLLGHGGWERLIVVAPILWVIAVGVVLWRGLPPSRATRDPSTSVGGA